MESEKLPPCKKMLPPFRVKQARLPDGEGIVRMKKDEYDELLRKQPRAALRYVDESDGEVILVGSALELDQKLSEPVGHAAKTVAGVPLDLYAAGRTPMHTFDIIKDEDVLQTWRGLDRRTTEEGQMAKRLFFGRQSLHQTPASTPRDPANDTATTHVPSSPAPVRFGEVSPPRNTLDKAQDRDSHRSSPHAQRWAAYGALPGSLNHAPVVVSTTSDANNHTETSIMSGCGPPPSDHCLTQYLIQSPSLSQCGPSPNSVLSSNHRVKSSQEHQPLLDMFWTQGQKDSPPETPKVSTDYQPLLSMYEKELSQLGTAIPTSSIDCNTKDETTPSQVPSNPVPAEVKAESDAHVDENRSNGPGEVLTQSIQSLLHGVGQLASIFKLTNAELQQQLAIAQKDLPNNIERTFRASIAAIESLRLALPTDKVTAATNRVRRSSRLGYRLSNRLPAPSPSSSGESEEVMRHNERVDRAVEEMRLRLLNGLNWSPGKIYTRADVLEGFLSYCNKAQIDGATITAQLPIDQTSLAAMKIQPQPRKGAARLLKHEVPFLADSSFDQAVAAAPSDKLEDEMREGLDGSGRMRRSGGLRVSDRPRRQKTGGKDSYAFEPSSILRHPSTQPSFGYKPSVAARRADGPKVDRIALSPISLPIPGVLSNDHIPYSFQATTMLGGEAGVLTQPPPPLPRPSRPDQPQVKEAEELDIQPTKPNGMASIKPGDLYSKPTQKLSSQISMPAIQSYNRLGSTWYIPSTGEFRSEFSSKDIGGPVLPMRSTGVLRSASTATRAYEAAHGSKSKYIGLARSNTIAGPSADTHRIWGASGSSANDDPQAKASNIRNCVARLVEMGFEPSRADTVAEAVMGDLESAVDVLEEDESARRQVKGKGRALVVPGSYNEDEDM